MRTFQIVLLAGEARMPPWALWSQQGWNQEAEQGRAGCSRPEP